MLDGAGGLRQHAQDLARVKSVIQQTALLCFPQHRDGVDGLVAAGQGRQALPQAGVQRRREVVGEQPPDGVDVGGVGRGGGEEDLLLLDDLYRVGPGGRRWCRGAGPDARAGREAMGDVVHDSGERVGLGEHRLDGVRKGDVVDGVDETFGRRLQAAAGAFGLDHPGIGGGVAGPGADLDEGVQVRGGQTARLLPACGKYAVEPLGVLRVLGRVGPRQGGDRGVQGGVRGGGERVGGDAAHVV